MIVDQLAKYLHDSGPPASSSSVSIVTCLLAALGAFAAFLKRSNRHLKSPRLHSWPWVGNAVAYASDPRAAIRTATAQCGRLFHVNMLMVDQVWLRGNDLNKLYTDVREDSWSFGGGMGLFLNKILTRGYFDHLKLLVRSLNAGINKSDTLSYYTQLAHEQAVEGIGNVSKLEEIDVFEYASKLVHRVIVRCLMGEDFYDNHVEELYDLLHRMEDDIGSILNLILPEWVPHPPARRLNACRDRVREIFEQRLSERQLDEEKWSNGKDYISYTLRDKATAHLQEHFPAHHTLLMFAAHTSTVASISWTVIELLRSPDRLRRMQDELRGPNAPNIHESPLLLASIRETGRYYSGVNMLRLARKPFALPNTDVTIPAGSIISISPYLTHHDPQNYSEPEKYAPERWMTDSDPVKQLNTQKETAFMPFGAGAHKCPGEKLAGIITREVVGTLIRDYDVSWGPSSPPKDFDNLDFSKIGSPWLKGDARISVRARQ